MTTTVWGGWTNGGVAPAMRIGVEYYLSPSTVTSSTSSVTIYARIRMNVNYGVNDTSNTLDISGTFWDSTSSRTIVMSNGDDIAITGYKSGTYSTSYTSTVSKTVSATLTGINVIPGTASVGTVTITIPKRPADVPGKITGVSISEITSVGCKTSWSTPATNGASLDKFNIAYYFDSAGTNIDTWGDFTPWATNFTTEYRDRATDYWVKVRAHNSAGWGAYSDLVKFTTLPTVPDQPSIAVGSITSSGATVTFTDANNGGAAVTSRKVQYSTSSSFTSYTTVTTTSLTRSLSGLTRNTTYYVRGATTNSVGDSVWSTTKSFTTLKTTPTAPQSPGFSGVTSTSAVVTYSAPLDNGGASVTSYNIQRALNSGFTSGVSTVSETGLSNMLIDLTPNTTYYVRVQAVNSEGGGTWSSTITFTTGSGVPTAPLSVLVTDVGAEDATLAWSDPASDGGSVITSYNVQVDLGLSTIFSGDVGLVYEYTATGLEHDNGYSMRVQAVNANGTGDWSDWYDANTTSRPPLAAVAPTVDNVTANGFDITAAVPADNGGAAISGYAFQVASDSGFENIVVDAASTLAAYSATALLPTTTYYVRTAAINSLGQGDWSPTTTQATAAGYQGVLPIAVGMTAVPAIAINAPIVVSSSPVSSNVIAAIVVDNAKVTIPNPLHAAPLVYPAALTAAGGAVVGLEAEAYIARNLFVEVALTGVLDFDAIAGLEVLLADATVPEIAGDETYVVGLEAYVHPHPYGDQLLEPALTLASGQPLTLRPVEEPITLEPSLDSSGGLPQVLTLEAVKGRSFL